VPAGPRSTAGYGPWLTTMSATAAIVVIGATVVNLSFLALGAELLGPCGIVGPGGLTAACSGAAPHRSVLGLALRIHSGR
jgi:hypothetical protein